MYERKRNMKKIFSVIVSATMLFCSFITANSISAEESDTDKIRVMPLGDSITDGFWLTGGYRTTLCNLLEENGYSDKVDMVGPNWGGDCYDPQHAGYSGYSIDNIDQADSISGARTGISSFADWLMQENPADVIMLQIGTNDILSYYDLDNICTRLENLVNQLLYYVDDDGMIYVSTIPCMDATNTLYISEYYFTSESMDAIVDKYNSEIKEMVSRLQSEGKNVALSDINSVLDKSDLYDGVHPNAEGYEKMGKYWYGILTDYINGGNNITDTTEPAETSVTLSETTETAETSATSSETIETAETSATPSETTETTVLTGTETATESEQTETEPFVPENPEKAGDLNYDGKIDIFDFTEMKNIVISGNNAYISSADMNGDGIINILDVSMLKQIILSNTK